ncbi:MAG: hypothetical protein ACWGNI_00365 [Desulfobacterales bacterium]
MNYLIPLWKDISEKIDNNEELNPLEKFIFDNEPPETWDAKWREDLINALNFYRES